MNNANRTSLSKRGKRKDRSVVPLILKFIFLPIFAIAYVINTLHVMSKQSALSVSGTGGMPVVDRLDFPQVQSNMNGRIVTLPSAKSILKAPFPFKIIPMSDHLVSSPNTVVTGYFRVSSKHSSQKYDGWMKNMLSLQDAMVVFTSPDYVEKIKELRAHAADKTVIIEMTHNDLPIGQTYSQEFWQRQLDRDPEKKIHQSYQVFWIWLSKSWLTTSAIQKNFFNSDLFFYSDIGCFRTGQYNNQLMIQHRDMVPQNELLTMAHHTPNPPATDLFNDKYKHKANFYHSGSQLVAYKDTWINFHEKFLETIDRFLTEDMIIVEDQLVLQSTCLSYPELCAYVPFKQVNDNHYFGLRYVVFAGEKGGDFKYWRYNKNAEIKK